MMGRPDSLEERLASSDYTTVLAAIADAIRAGEFGETALVNRIASGPNGDVLVLVAALGDCEGPRGAALLHEIANRDVGDSNVRCASLVALAKRVGTPASDTFARALESRSGSVKDCAVGSLAAVGDDRAWEQVFERLRTLLGRKTRNYVALDPTDVELCVAYLGRHLGTAADRHDRVVGLVGRRWNRLGAAERRWIHDHWSACDPGSSAPDVEPRPDVLQAWARTAVLVPAF
jgi:hypothetical protein